MVVKTPGDGCWMISIFSTWVLCIGIWCKLSMLFCLVSSTLLQKADILFYFWLWLCRNTSPAPRFDHIATVHADQYLLIFGGSSHSACFNDLHVLDLQTVSLIFFSGCELFSFLFHEFLHAMYFITHFKLITLVFSGRHLFSICWSLVQSISNLANKLNPRAFSVS